MSCDRPGQRFPGGGVQRDEKRHLQHEGQTSGRGIHAALAVELHLLLAETLAILAVLLLQLVHRRRDLLHRSLGADLRDVQGIQREADQDRHEDHGQAEVADDRVREEREIHDRMDEQRVPERQDVH
jgi:hypothetical protein